MVGSVNAGAIHDEHADDAAARCHRSQCVTRGHPSRALATEPGRRARSPTRPVAVATVRGGGVTIAPNVLWIIAVIVAIIGIIVLVGKCIIWGIVLLVIVAALIGPGGYSIFRGRMR